MLSTLLVVGRSFGPRRAFGAVAGVLLVGCSSVGRIPEPGIAGPRALSPRVEVVEAALIALPEATVPGGRTQPEQAPDVAPPTWATIYARYFGPRTEGSCGRAHGCHAEAMADADSAYRWLAQRGYITGPSSPLVNNNSCLRWFGGNMPPRGSLPNEEAMRDLGAWAAAGAPNN